MFYRATMMSMKWYAIEIDSVEDDAENIEEFASQGTAVVIVDDLEVLSSFGAYEVVLVEDDD